MTSVFEDLVVVAAAVDGSSASVTIPRLAATPPIRWPQAVLTAAWEAFAQLSPRVHPQSIGIEMAGDTDPSTWRGRCSDLPGASFTCYWQGALS